MSQDDPFGGDEERTIIRPNPGGRLNESGPDGGGTIAPGGYGQRPAAPAPAPQAPPPRPAAPGEVVPIAVVGLNPLVKAASTILGLAIRMRNRAQHNNVDALHQRVVAEVKRFEQIALQEGIAAQAVRIARYALCATIDDLVLNTPWGSNSVWAQRSMVGSFHNEVSGGERFYDLLEKMQKDPAANRDVLELLYLCMSLGFEGMMRVEDRGNQAHMRLRDSTLRDIRAHRGEIERDLSPHWRGVGAGHKPLTSFIPTWMVAVITLALLCFTYMGFNYLLNGESDKLYGEISALPPTGKVDLARAAPTPPPPPPKLDTSQFDRIRQFLAPEIAEGLVSVFEDTVSITVRIHGKGMFPSGRDQVNDSHLRTLQRIAEAIEAEPGNVIVAGHSDNVPIRSARFPSNWHLSLARAESVMNLMLTKITDRSRFAAEGRAENEPIAGNDTAQGRAQNRRIEVILLKL